MKRYMAVLLAVLLTVCTGAVFPASAATEIRIEAEDADEWGGWAGTKDFDNASNKKVVSGLNTHPYKVHFVAFTGWLSQLEPGDYTLTVSYMTGDPDMSLIARVNDKEYSIACPTTTKQDPWIKWEPGTVTTTITLTGNGMDELKFYEGVPGGVWIDYFTLKKGKAQTPAPASSTPAPAPSSKTVISSSPQVSPSSAETAVSSETESETVLESSSVSSEEPITVSSGIKTSSANPTDGNPDKPFNPVPLIIIGVVILGAGAGAVIYFLKFRKKKE